MEALRQRSSTKWRTYPASVIPMFVAETDFPLAEPIRAALRTAVEIGDTGYTPPEPGLRESFVAYAQRQFGWEVNPAYVRSTCDVMMGVVELLRARITPGDRVIITTPVYPPFAMSVPEAGGVVEAVPLRDTGSSWELDLEAIERALRAGARAVLIANPHNPTGTAFARAQLVELARIARLHDAVVVSDEIHAPLVHPGHEFVPFVTVSEDAAAIGFSVVSASKAYNLAGLKCALMVADHPDTARTIDELVPEVEWRTGLFGAISTVAAFDPASDPWLESLRVTLDGNRTLLAELLGEHLPKARYRVPDAGFLAWVDVSEYGWGDDPAVAILEGAEVALHHGPLFGPEGVGHVRVNFGCAPDVLREAIERIGEFARRSLSASVL